VKENLMIRRKFFVGIILSALVLALAACGGAKSESKSSGKHLDTIKVGYLHTVAVDENMWVGKQLGIWKKEGIRLKTTQFDTGVSLAKALAGGSLDVGIMGSVLSNFASRGQGEVFLANNIEAHSVKFYGRDGIKSIRDLKGKKVITTVGAAGSVVLDRALKKNHMSLKDVNLTNADMTTAVNAYISGNVPALVTWLPFNVKISKHDPSQKPFASGDKFYPKGSGLLGGWVANNDFYKSNKGDLRKIVNGWLQTNPIVKNQPDKVVKILHKKAYKDVKPGEIKQMHEAAQLYSNGKWAKFYKNGHTADLIGLTEKSFISIGVFKSYVKPDKFFDPDIYLKAYKSSGH
jgi:NitT/TauT family transport system substrate-binding protein